MTINIGRLQPGQIVRHEEALYKVNYVNECRAYITPLRKKDLVKKDDVDPAKSGGVSIAPNAMCEIIEDLETTQTLMEIAEAEREAREARQAIVDQEREAAKPATVKPPKPATAATPRGPRTSAGGWRVIEGVQPRPKDGTLGAAVYDHVLAHPGQTTLEIVTAVEATGVKGAIAACVSRFNQAGVFVKE